MGKNNLETGYFLQQDQTKNRNYYEYHLQWKYEQRQLLAILPERVATNKSDTATSMILASSKLSS